MKRFYIFVLYLATPTIFAWHAYEKPFEYEKTISEGTCERTFLVPKTVQKSTEASKFDLKLWPGLVNDGDMINGGSLYGMKEAMEIIYRHQHPVDCSNAKFMISEGYQSGFGSEIHVEGLGLALAIASNRIFLPRPTQHQYHGWQVNQKICGYSANTAYNMWSQHVLNGSPKGTTMDCYYEPWTNCSIDWTKYDQAGALDLPRAFRATSEDILYFKRHGQLPPTVGGAFHHHKVLRMIMPNHFDDFQTFIPPIFNTILSHKCSPKMKAGSEHYWWRAVSATYLLRPNAKTLKLIKSHRDKTLDTLNGNCVSMYIRHGDKGRENFKLLNFSVYGNAAKLLYDNQLVPPDYDYHLSSSFSHYRNRNNTDMIHFGKINHNTNSNFSHFKKKLRHKIRKKTIYLATDDPRVLQDAIVWGRIHGYEIRHSALLTEVLTHDGVGIGAGTDVREGRHPMKYASRNSKNKPYHHELEYFSVLLHLNDIMKCGAFVCTIGSNFCRVMDEMRATVGGKANRVFADLGNTCNPNDVNATVTSTATSTTSIDNAKHDYHTDGNMIQPCLFGKGISYFDW